MPRLLAWLLLSLVLPLTACAQAPSGPVQAGRDYEVLPQGQRWQPANGKIEVAEVFAYWCHHCADFQPMVDAWKTKQAADVSFTYVPVAFDLDDTYALAYFAAESAKALPKVHNALFDAIHKDGSLPRNNPTVGEVGTWFAQKGLNQARMVALMESKDTAAKMQRVRTFMKANGIQGTPTLVVNGKYVVRGASLADRLRVADALVAMERAKAKR
ncbi:MAG: thiol:disulfide interchange protein DsbA/DsbL [Xanthomonadaceae bacterium]|nr:thiol:disulfide interchange protein DsbA/DsbL [Xanthomonadaceae bacterium]